MPIGAISLQPLTPDHVQQVLQQHNLNAEITFFENSTATSQLAADNIGCQLGQIVKSIAFIVNGDPILVLTSGDQFVDDRKIATIYEVGRKKVKTAKPEQCVEIFGYAPGGVPPFGHRATGFPIHVDESLQRFDMLYAAGGAHNAIFPITLDQLLTVSGGKLTDVVKD
jgi:prolyl-tRNA editing enzyme YbaK/EbsC (Cys-tRNA(Pro) deacylase)